MPTRIRPLLAVRLIGQADLVRAEKRALVTYLARRFGGRATCRTSTHPARHVSDLRVYITMTAEEEPPR